MRHLRAAVAPLLGLALLGSAACISTEPIVSDVEPRTLTYAPSLGVDFAQMVETDEGLYYRDIELGEPGGELIAAGDSIRVRYALWLPNGNLVEDRRTTAVDVDLNRTIAGWQLGVPGMREGGTRLLVIRPALGYGGVSFPNLPRNSVLVYQVTVDERLGTGGP